MLARIRKSMAEKDQGFTLIELLVVMIIIGILAAIAIPVFLNQRKRAVDSSIKSDLRAIANQMETYYTDSQVYILPTQASAGADVMVSTDAVKVSGTNQYTFRLLSNSSTSTSTATSATGYCIIGSGNGKGSGATINYNSLTGGIISADCPAAAP